MVITRFSMLEKTTTQADFQNLFVVINQENINLHIK